MNKDHVILGLISGMIVPLLGIFIFYMLRYMPQHLSLGDFVYLMRSDASNISKMISLGLIAAIPLITYYKNRRRYKTLQGIFIAILLYAAMAVIFRFHLF
jgi:uncharacterized membrane protein